MDFLIIIIWTIGFILYFLPTIIGWNKRNSNAILAINLLLGWTFIGWMVAFIWSLSKDATPIIISKKSRKKKKKNKKSNKKIDLANENIESDISPVKEWNIKNENKNLK
ncbi:T4 superinfection immunity protein [Gillisia mitskevichiae]|uniref:T4 superinfection immunity protein n=1 Tax=Gillisia mitskevichiae TaxID=270921 RepID=A0A495NXR2_9FLAO|nr:superinfection immunity protein [Gillisia mitskevichiae]RKS42667.1 T4 superinfection immunity protein [Gillisia mitskevichiae]